jgi:hypothetical protein
MLIVNKDFLKRGGVMEKQISLLENFRREFEAIKIQRTAVENYRKRVVQNRKSIARSSRLSPPETKILTHQDRLEMIKKLGENSERRRKSSEQIKNLLDSFRTRYAELKRRESQKQIIVNVPVGASVVLVFG